VPQNLLSNPGAEEGIGEGQGWQLKSGGDGWAVGQLDDDTTVEQLGGCQRFFISSYSVPHDTRHTTHTTHTTHDTRHTRHTTHDTTRHDTPRATRATQHALRG
jgi:hypothetical protein